MNKFIFRFVFLSILLFNIYLCNLNIQDKFPKIKFLYQEQQQLTAAPAALDWRSLKPICFKYVRNQGICSASTAISVAVTLQTRICINSGSLLELSAQDLISCASFNFQCKTDLDLKDAWTYSEKVGITSERCIPFLSDQAVVPQCPSSCLYEKDPYYRYKIKPNTIRSFLNADDLKNEIMIYGPVTSVMTIFEDFSLYKEGIYQHKFGAQISQTTVVILGWGVEKGVEFWICMNTWGAHWGEGGYFRVAVGDPSTNLIVNALAATPLE